MGTLVQNALVVVVSLVSGRVSDRAQRPKVFVVLASLTSGVALFAIAAAPT